MGEPTKIASTVANASGTSALATWGLWRRIVKSPEKMAEWRAEHPEQAAAEDRAIEEARAAARAAAPPSTSAAAPREELARRMRAAGAPPERVADWLGWYDTPAGGFVRAWLADLEASGRPSILVLSGAAGSGKTVAALDAMAWAFRARSRGPAHYAPMRETVALGRWREEGARWDEVRDAKFLLLDEAVGGLDEYRKDRADELLCARYDSGRPTCITTNLAPAVILDKKRGPFGERVASRLGDKRACRIAECGTVDLRAQPRQEAKR